MSNLWSTINFGFSVFVFTLTVINLWHVLDSKKSFDELVKRSNKQRGEWQEIVVNLRNTIERQKIFIQFYESFIEVMLKDNGESLAKLKKLASETCEKMGFDKE
jgi:hypothetical protein